MGLKTAVDKRMCGFGLITRHVDNDASRLGIARLHRLQAYGLCDFIYASVCTLDRSAIGYIERERRYGLGDKER